jgi:hypothetical protein
LSDGSRLDRGVRSCRALANDPRARTALLGHFDPPPFGQEIQRCLKVALGADHGQTVEDPAIGKGLTRQSREAVAVALDLKAFEAPIYESDVDSALAGEDTHLIDDPHVWIVAVSQLQPPMQLLSYLWIKQRFVSW